MQNHTYCRLCEGACGLLAEVEGDELLGLSADPSDPVSEGYVCDVARHSAAVLGRPERFTSPMRREGSELVPATWEEAVADITERLRSIRSQSGARSLGLYLGEGVQRSSHTLLRSLAVSVALGTPNVFSTLSTGSGPRQRAAELMLGHPVNLVPDLGRAHFVVLLSGGQEDSDWGPQFPGMAHGRWLEHSRKTKGTKVIVADPRKPEGNFYDQHVPIRPGTELYFLLGMAAAILKGGWVDLQYLRDYTTGVKELEDLLAPWTVERCAEACGISAAQLSGVSLKFSQSAMAVVHPGRGTFNNGHGLATAWAWMLVHTLSANTLRPGGIYDHQAIFDLHPALSSVPTDDAPRTRVAGHPLLLLQAPASALADEILTPGEGQVRALISVDGDPASELPGSPRAREALDSLDLLVSLARFPNETTARAHWVLPLTHSWEQTDLHLLDAATLPYHMTQMAPGLVPPRGEARTADAILRELYSGVHPGLRGSVYGRHLGLVARLAAKADLDEWVGRLAEWLGDVDMDELEQPPHRINRGDTNRATWRVSHSDNRIHLVPPGVIEALADLRPVTPDARFPLLLRTSARKDRAPDAFHRAEPLEPGVGLSPALGIADGAKVRVETAFGAIEGTARLDESLREDTVDLPAGYSLDANALLSDARSDRWTGAPELDGLVCQVTSL